MPKEVQNKLNQVVGLMKMDWPVFSEHIVHNVDTCRAENSSQEEQSRMLSAKLTQIQIGELTKNIKKDRDKTKYQASVTTTASEIKSDPAPEVKAEPVIIQASMFAAAVTPPQTLQQPSVVQQPNYATAPSTMQQALPILVHFDQGGNTG